MGQVVAFKRPLALAQSLPPAPGELAEEFYRQCRVTAIAEGFNAQRRNPALDVNRLVPSLTRTFAEDMIAQKLLESMLEDNNEKREVANELQRLVETRLQRTLAISVA